MSVTFDINSRLNDASSSNNNHSLGSENLGIERKATFSCIEEKAALIGGLQIERIQRENSKICCCHHKIEIVLTMKLGLHNFMFIFKDFSKTDLNFTWLYWCDSVKYIRYAPEK